MTPTKNDHSYIGNSILLDTLKSLARTLPDLNKEVSVEIAQLESQQSTHRTLLSPDESPEQNSTSPATYHTFELILASYTENGDLNDIRDLRFWFYNALRTSFHLENFQNSSELLNDYCEACNTLLNNTDQPIREIPSRLYISTIRTRLELDKSLSTNNINRTIIALSCIGYSLGYFSLHTYKEGYIKFFSRTFDQEFVKSSLFGSWLTINGFNNLFGGGGPYLFAPDATMPGRLILIEGSYGNGKSTLALSIASDVARKGGIAWLIPFEQSIEECRINLADMNLLPRQRIDAAIDNYFDLESFLSDGDRQSGGALLMMRVGRESWRETFSDIQDVANRISNRICRCVFVDPINAISDSESSSAVDLRKDFFEKVNGLKQIGINVILVSEASNNSSLHEISKKIADVVIELSVSDCGLGYLQRFIEISKSRLQREQRGKHPFTIKSRGGINIFLSSAAVSARIRQRNVPSNVESARFGWRPIDDILGVCPFINGDVLVMSGPTGTLKSELANIFSTGFDRTRGISNPNSRCSLFIPLRDSADSVSRMFARGSSSALRGKTRQSDQFRSNQRVIVAELPVGFVQPGLIFRAIEEHMDSARRQNLRIDRVVFDNVEQWDLNCPFLSSDPIFAMTLVDFCRRYGMTSLFVMHKNSSRSELGEICNTIMNSSDLQFDFEKISFRGGGRTIFRVAKSRDMLHRSEYFDLCLNRGSLEIGVRSRLLRIDESGRVGTVPIRFYLHNEGTVQSDYNSGLAASLRPVLSHDIKEVSEDRTSVLRSISVGGYSTVDELQILQVDEFQLPDLMFGNSGSPVMFPIAIEEIDAALIQDPDTRMRIMLNDSSAMVVPYYQNVGVFVVKQDLAFSELSDDLSWPAIIKCAIEFELSPKGFGNQLFFDFCCDKNETFNCLFFEIALGMGFSDPAVGETVRSWLSRNFELLPSVVSAFSILGSRAYRLHQGKMFNFDRGSFASRGPDAISGLPIVSRHWFTTASEMLSLLPKEMLSRFKVVPIKKSVSGEWYLGVPNYSSSPEVAVEIIRMIQSEREEAERLRRGVGLPIRKNFYSDSEGSIDSVRTQYFSFSGNEVQSSIAESLRRSKFSDYSKVSPILSFHLKKILEDPALFHARDARLEVATRRLFSECR